ncbi:MAG: response regulator [Actinomycetota bacterium]|nr:response regulator [Actinomycetota bacterium]
MDEITYYKNYLAGTLIALQESLEKGVWKIYEKGCPLHITAHSLRGSGATYGFPEITEAASALEESTAGQAGRKLAALISVIRMVIGVEGSMRLHAANETTQAHEYKKRKLLIADDDQAVVKIASLALEKSGEFDVIAAINAAEAVKLALEEKPDAILLDFMLSESSGTEVLQTLRANAQTRTIPVIFFTSRADGLSEKKFIELGAIGVIAKPFDPFALPAQVGKFF